MQLGRSRDDNVNRYGNREERLSMTGDIPVGIA